MSNTEPRVEVRPDRRSVLPWRRHHVDVEVAPLIAAYRDRHRKADTALIEQAFEVARVAHADQVRRSGEPYIAHPLGVAMILAGLGLDDVTIAAALLHDAVEDTTVTDKDLQQRFGSDVAAIVDGVTKLDRLQFDSKEAQQAATHRPGDTRHLCTAGAPARDRRREVAARGPRVRRAAPEAVRRDRADGLVASSRTRGVPGAGVDGAPSPPRRVAHRRRRTRPSEELLVDLREDGRAGQGVR